MQGGHRKWGGHPRGIGSGGGAVVPKILYERGRNILTPPVTKILEKRLQNSKLKVLEIMYKL